MNGQAQVDTIEIVPGQHFMQVNVRVSAGTFGGFVCVLFDNVTDGYDTGAFHIVQGVHVPASVAAASDKADSYGV